MTPPPACVKMYFLTLVFSRDVAHLPPHVMPLTDGAVIVKSIWSLHFTFCFCPSKNIVTSGRQPRITQNFFYFPKYLPCLPRPPCRGDRYYRKNIDRRDISIFSSYRQIIDIEKIDLGIIEKLSLSKMCIRFHPISTVQKQEYESISYPAQI